MQLVFMGTPEFALPSFLKLTESSHIVSGVVTQPDRPRGRGLQVARSAVKQAALLKDIPILQPEKLKDPSFIRDLKTLDAECFVVVGFRILPREVFEMPPSGTINLHASLLPRYRGAAPIQWALMNGDEKTGVTTFFIEKSVDTGDLILQQEVAIKYSDTAGDLHDRLALAGSELILKTLDEIQQGTSRGLPQIGDATPAPKITADHCRINWMNSAVRISNQIRALSPYPGAFTSWNDKRLKLFCASADDDPEKSHMSPGTVIYALEDSVLVKTGRGNLRFAEIQVEGKRRMTVKAFLKGRLINQGDYFGTPDTLDQEE